MTIIAGFKGYDGIVLCSDTQETIEQSHVVAYRDSELAGGAEFRTSKHGAGRHSRKAFYPDWVRSAYLHDLSADRLTWRGFGRR